MEAFTEVSGCAVVLVGVPALSGPAPAPLGSCCMCLCWHTGKGAWRSLQALRPVGYRGYNLILEVVWRRDTWMTAGAGCRKLRVGAGASSSSEGFSGALEGCEPRPRRMWGLRELGHTYSTAVGGVPRLSCTSPCVWVVASKT